MAEASTSIGNHPCQARRKDGAPCSVRALTGSVYCFAHDPAKVAERDAARRKGGAGKATRQRLAKIMPVRLLPVWDQLERALVDVLDGSLDPKQATAAAAVARALAAILTAGEMEQRIRQLEEAAS